MRNRAIQSNIPFVAPSDEFVDQEFALGETLNDKIILNNPSNSPHHDALHSDPNLDHSSDFMFDDDNASIVAPPVRSSIHFSQNPSLSRPSYDFRISLSSSEPVDEEIQAEGESETNPPKDDQAKTANKVGASE